MVNSRSPVSGAAALVIAALLLGGPAAASAQVGIGVAGGPSYPTGALGDVVESGYHAGVTLDAGLPLLPIAFRADLMFQNLPGREDLDSFRQVAGTVNGRVGVLPIPLVSPYLIGGLGLYASDFVPDPDIDGGWSTDVGINAGVGVRLNLLVIRPFIEARYHRVLSDPARGFIPITAGIHF